MNVNCRITFTLTDKFTNKKIYLHLFQKYFPGLAQASLPDVGPADYGNNYNGLLKTPLRAYGLR